MVRARPVRPAEPDSAPRPGFATLPATKPVRLICIGSFPGTSRLQRARRAAPHELASLLDTRQPGHRRAYVLARRAWHAFRAPTPEALDELRRDDTSRCRISPPRSRAFSRNTRGQPTASREPSGGSWSWQRMTHRLAAAFPRMHEGEDAYYVTDRSLADLAEPSPHLAAAPHADTAGRNGGPIARRIGRAHGYRPACWPAGWTGSRRAASIAGWAARTCVATTRCGGGTRSVSESPPDHDRHIHR